jgi:NAD-dependent SIR2 family protein deacetylase
MGDSGLNAQLLQAAKIIKAADALLINTGAGMGVSSGLGTFRGKAAGVWPPLAKLGIDFSDMSCPDRFQEDPTFAWSFWNFRYTRFADHQVKLFRVYSNQYTVTQGILRMKAIIL